MAPKNIHLAFTRKLLVESCRLHVCFAVSRSAAPARGGKGGRLPPNVEKDGSRDSSKFDEKIGRGDAYPSQM